MGMKNPWFPLASYGKLFVHYGSFPLSQMNLLTFTTQAVPMLNQHGTMTTVDQITTLVYPREQYSQLIHTALGILRAQKEEELQFAQLAGFVLVTGIDLDA